MSSDSTPLKVAIVHDWLIGGGAEKVVLELHHMYPDAPVYTSFATPEWRTKLDGKVVTGFLQHFGRLRKFVPFLRIWWFTHLNLSGFDLVISSSGAEAKGIKVQSGTKHINYCHAPTHYYWGRYDEYMQHSGFGFFDPLARVGLRILVGPLRKWDYTAAQRPDAMVANSVYTREMISRYYNRDSNIVHPPVDVERFTTAHNTERSGFVITGRQTPYKRVDLAVRACTQLGLPLKVIGNGPDHARLVGMAGPTIEFLTNVPDSELPGHLQSAHAFLFPAKDDFGISAVEALAAGTPVIAYQDGGALDYVIPGVSGEFFEEQTVESLVTVLSKFDPTVFNSKAIKLQAQNFSPAIFRTKMQLLIDLLRKENL